MLWFSKYGGYDSELKPMLVSGLGGKVIEVKCRSDLVTVLLRI